MQEVAINTNTVILATVTKHECITESKLVVIGFLFNGIVCMQFVEPWDLIVCHK